MLKLCDVLMRSQTQQAGEQRRSVAVFTLICVGFHPEKLKTLLPSQSQGRRKGEGQDTNVCLRHKQAQGPGYKPAEPGAGGAAVTCPGLWGLRAKDPRHFK